MFCKQTKRVYYPHKKRKKKSNVKVFFSSFFFFMYKILHTSDFPDILFFVVFQFSLYSTKFN